MLWSRAIPEKGEAVFGQGLRKNKRLEQMERFKNRDLCSRIALKLALGLSVLMLGGCTVQPLYSTRGGDLPAISGDIGAHLAAISIANPRDRYTQILRNRLVYLINNEAKRGDEAIAPYQLELRVNVAVMAAVRIDIGDRTVRTGRASAGTVRATASYRLVDDKNTQIASKRRAVSASFDRPRQEYANLQAEEDAKRRALEELAEQIYLSLAQDMVKNAKRS